MAINGLINAYAITIVCVIVFFCAVFVWEETRELTEKQPVCLADHHKCTCSLNNEVVIFVLSI